MTTHAEPLAGEQTTAADALITLLAEFPALPTANIDFATGIDDERLCIHVHDNPAGFEQWREALGLDPEQADGHRFDTFQTIELPGTYRGVAVRLVGYLHPASADASAA